MPPLRQQDSRPLQNLQHQMLNGDCGCVLGSPPTTHTDHRHQGTCQRQTQVIWMSQETLSCRSGPLPLLTAQLYFQNTFVDGVSTTVSAAHAEVDTRALSSTSLCEGISQIRLQKFITHWGTEFWHPW